TFSHVASLSNERDGLIAGCEELRTDGQQREQLFEAELVHLRRVVEEARLGQADSAQGIHALTAQLQALQAERERLSLRESEHLDCLASLQQELDSARQEQSRHQAAHAQAEQQLRDHQAGATTEREGWEEHLRTTREQFET